MARLGELKSRRTALVSTAKLRGIDAVLADFGNFYTEAVTTQIKDERVREERLRVSSFPYCGTRHAYERLTAHERVPMTDFGSLYYTSIGTQAHEVIQTILGMRGKIYGDWKCACGSGRKFSAKSKCPKCGKEMQYEELTVKAFKNVSGHLDGIWKDSEGRYWLIDYKTSSVRVISSQKTNPTLPYHHNVHQIKAYCALVEKTHDIEIAGWILMYVARDNPMVFSKPVGKFMNSKAKTRELKKIKGYDRDWSRVIEAEKFSDLMEIVDDKPCESLEDYGHKFGDSLNPCPLARSGICFQPKRLKKTLKIVWEERPAAFRA